MLVGRAMDGGDPGRTRGGRLALALALAGAVVLLYLPAVDFGLVNFDDPDYVTDNPILNAPSWPAAVRRSFSPHAGHFIPLTWLSLLLDRAIFGPGSGGFHLANLLLHATNAVVLFLVLAAMTGATWRSWVVAALFALHPLRVESVAWVTERKDVLSSLGAFAMIGAWVGWVRRPTPRAYALVLAAFVAGLLAKPMLVPMPLVLLLLDFWPLRRVGAGRWTTGAVAGLLREKVPLFAISALAAVVTYLVQEGRGAVMPIGTLGLGQRLANALQSFAWYPAKTLWPDGLSFFYPLHPVSPAVAIACALALAAVTGACLKSGKDRPYLAVGWLWYVLLLLPVVGLVQVGEQARADRFTYLPTIGLALAAVWLVADLVPAGRPRRALAVATALMLAGQAVAARGQLMHWRDSITLGSRALAVDPENYRAHMMVGMTLREAGQIEAAMPHYEAVMRQLPDYAEARLAYANLLLGAKRPAEALPMLEALVAHPDASANVLNSYGRCLIDLGRPADAEKVLRRAATVDPELALARINLGTALAQTGRADEAVAALGEAVRLAPRNPDAQLMLGIARGSLGDDAGAVVSLREAVRLRPGSAEGHYSLAVELNATGDSAGARQEIEAALRLRPAWRRAQAFREGLVTGTFPAMDSITD